METMSPFLIRLLRNAGDIMLQAHEIETGHNITDKPGTVNFVTVYDVRVQDFLKAEILKVLPEAVFFAEEQENNAADLESDCCFIIDPIDGTTNFIHDYRRSCISLAMLSRGEVVFGAVFDPYLDELFHAVKGEGAYVNGNRISVSDRPFERAVVAFGTSPYYKDTLAERTFALCKAVFLAAADVRRTGSAAIDLAYLAAGRNDAFFECVLSPWDYAAGALLVTEAGGIITDMAGNPLSFDKPLSILAGNPAGYEALKQCAANYIS